MTVRSATLLFFVNALLSFGAIWLVQSFAPGLLWVPILVGSVVAWVLFYLVIQATRQEERRGAEAAALRYAADLIDPPPLHQPLPEDELLPVRVRS